MVSVRVLDTLGKFCMQLVPGTIAVWMADLCIPSLIIPGIPPLIKEYVVLSVKALCMWAYV